MPRAPLALAIALGWVLAPAPRAQIGKLVMPGEVVRAHADLENDCAKCHDPFAKAAQSQLCLDCHDDVAADRTAHSGYHGRAPEAVSTDCRVCHTDHEGRDARIVRLDADTFDHARTDFVLHGAHARVACASCHAAGAKLRDAASNCAACHGKTDPHQGRLGEDCAKCHDAVNWRKSAFDHERTRFPLRGQHATTACAACHPTQRFVGAATTCVGCHAADDHHMGRFGTKCESCHVAEDWKRLIFDHARDAKFALAGAHARVECTGCHRGDLYGDELERSCASCHRADDVHRGRFGSACEQCHSTASWRVDTFDHGKRTRFTLFGKHRTATCEACHKTESSDVEVSQRCAACHAREDVHLGQEGDDCGRCHNADGWRERVAFDHDLARFPLLGLHAVVPCEECHRSAAFRDVRSTCVECHAKDDAHQGELGPNCALCHTPNAWAVWSFDHATRTRFPLTGAHSELNCHDCHATPVENRIELSTQCVSCHEPDDVHHGAYGRSCERCHETRTFRGAAPR